MALILHIETATAVCSVALAQDGKLILEKTIEEPRAHARLLTVAVDDTMKEAGYIYNQLSAVAVSKGPGSYTGLRIGVAAAKGLCYSLEIPLLAVNTLYSMAFCARRQWTEEGRKLHDKLLFCPMIDARRMEVYTSVFNISLGELSPVQAMVLEPSSFDRWKDGELVFFGDGAEKYSAVINPELNSDFFSGFIFSSAGLVEKSYERYQSKAFEDTAYFEPFYLKDFIAGPPKKA
jgi:tRNA threonylcarbamoyladenosine biosynthesis protein TsaB